MIVSVSVTIACSTNELYHLVKIACRHLPISRHLVSHSHLFEWNIWQYTPENERLVPESTPPCDIPSYWLVNSPQYNPTNRWILITNRWISIIAHLQTSNQWVPVRAISLQPSPLLWRIFGGANGVPNPSPTTTAGMFRNTGQILESWNNS